MRRQQRNDARGTNYFIYIQYIYISICTCCTRLFSYRTFIFLFLPANSLALVCGILDCSSEKEKNITGKM